MSALAEKWFGYPARLRHWAVAGQAALVIFAFAGAVVAAVLSYQTIDEELTDAALSRRASLSDLAAATLTEKFDHLVDVSISLATRVRFRQLVAAGEWTQAIEIVRGVPRDLPFIERLFLADTAGTLRADVPELPGVRGTSFAYRDWYQGVTRSGAPYISPIYTRAAAPQVVVFAVAAPVRNDGGTVAGILVMQVRLDTYFDWARTIEIGPGGFVYIVDAKGQVAYHSKWPQRSEITAFPAAPAVQRVLHGERGVKVEFDPIEREEAVLAYTPVPAYGWGVVVQQPARAAFAAKDQQLRRLLIAYALVASLCGLVIYLSSRIIVESRQAEQHRLVKVELERRVAERTAELEAVNKELESFSYSVSHDLRAPLRAVDGFSRMLEEDYSGKLDDEGRRLLNVIRDSGRKMGQLIDDLLTFSRLGKKLIAASGIDMMEQARAVFGELADGDDRIRLELGPLPAAWGDPALVRQVWLNLLSNAIKFSAQRPAPLVTVTGRVDATGNIYCVKDNGAGFDMRYYDKLFGVFQRLHSPEEFPGTGVGLAIVQRVVARHGGRVWAEGKEGEGAAFYFALPGGKARG